MRNWIRLKKLERELDKVEKQYRIFQQSEKYKKLSGNDKRAEDTGHAQIDYFPIKDQIEEIKSNIFLKKVQKYGIPYPRYYDKDNKGYWEKSFYEYSCHYLTEKGYHALRKAIREEQKARRETILCWMPLITVLTGLVGAIAAVLTIIKYWGK